MEIVHEIFSTITLKIVHEIFSTVTLTHPLIQEGKLSVSGQRMCTRLLVECLLLCQCTFNIRIIQGQGEAGCSGINNATPYFPVHQLC